MIVRHALKKRVRLQAPDFCPALLQNETKPQARNGNEHPRNAPAQVGWQSVDADTE